MAQSDHHAPRGMRIFLIIWFGELISIIGSGMTSFGLGVWIYQKTGQATPFALTALFGTLPRVLLLPLGGMLADRWNRRLLMILADVGSALTTLAALLLLAAGKLEIWNIYVLSILSSICAAFQDPAYRSSVTMLVEKKDLGRASGLMSASEALTMLVSPLLAGLLFAPIGLTGIMIIDFVTFFFAFGALLFVRIPQPALSAEEAGKKASLRADMGFAWRYLVARPGLFWLMWYFALVNFSLNLATVLTGPLVLSFGSATTLGIVEVVFGIAMLGGSVLMGAWGGPKRRITGIFVFISICALGLVIVGLHASALVISIGFFIMLFCVPLGSGASQALSQAKIEPSVQGRVFSMRSMVSQSMMPVAFAISGPLADKVFGPLMMPGGALASTFLGQIFGVGVGRGIGLMFTTAGLFLLVAGAVAWSFPRIRNVEDELPDVVVKESGPLPVAGGQLTLESER
jgi:MFS transporter, DHA3 family, macrolide efflux protein